MKISRRVVALGVVLAGLALAAVGDALLAPPRGGAGTASTLSDAVSQSPAASAAWYCAGPLPIGAGSTTSSVVVANLSSRRLVGTVTIASTTLGPHALVLTVPPTSARTVVLPTAGAAGDAAVSVVMDGSGVGVEELSVGPSGIDSARCATHLRTAEHFATGSTLGGDALSLALFDPTATPAVVNVDFATGTGAASSALSSPAAFQGVPVAAGHLVVLDVGKQVPEHGLVATSVHTTGGRIVAGMRLRAPRPGLAETSALLEGSPGRSTSWSFGADPTGSPASDLFSVYDPGSQKVVAHLAFGTPTGVVSAELPVAAGGVATLEAPPSASPALWVTVTSPQRVGIVVARTVVVARGAAALPGPRVTPVERARLAALAKSAALTAAARAAQAAGATTTAEARAVSTSPALAPGTSLSPGVPRPERRWLLAGGISSAGVGELVTVANPGSRAATFRIFRLASSGTTTVGLPPLTGDAVPGPAGPLGPTQLAIPAERLASLRIPAQASVTLDLDYLVGEPGTLSLVVTASRPVVVGAILYARGSRPSAGFVSVDGIPVG